MHAVVNNGESWRVERINGRQNNDIYFFINGTGTNKKHIPDQ